MSCMTTFFINTCKFIKGGFRSGKKNKRGREWGGGGGEGGGGECFPLFL